jgi:hypothetical protein
MPAVSLETEAFVLAKRLSPADGWQVCTLFAPEHGPLQAMQRVPKKLSAHQVMLDLFDQASLVLESSNQGRTWFVREARLITRHAAIGRSYAALQGASALVRLVARNAVSPDGRAAVAALLRTALASFGTAERPDVVSFKSLYCFARDEGYPVKQAWLAGLPAADRATAALILNRPLAEQTNAPAEVAALQRRLEDYLRGDTEILVD